jgi:hypothetical protein
MEGEIKRGTGTANPHLEMMEHSFWRHVEYIMSQTGETEQQVLDAIKTPGYTGRRARQRGITLTSRA